YTNNIVYMLGSTTNTINNYTIRSDNPNFESINGLIYTEDLKTLIACPMNRKKVTVIDGVETILSAFQQNQNSTSVGPIGSKADIQIPNSVKKINSSFYIMPSLKWIELWDGLETIDGQTFSFSNNHNAIYIPKTVINIPKYYDNYNKKYCSIFLSAQNGLHIYCERQTTDTEYLGTVYNWADIWNCRYFTSEQLSTSWNISREWFRNNCEN
ncbi:leucine-rich repeat protein, partial [bacterium]|nr:leucine-rich repeat protein [bacterium]